MAAPKILIALPLKTSNEYLDRMIACEATWLKDVLHANEICGGRYCNGEPCQRDETCPCPVRYKGFRDSELGLDENYSLVRQKRMKGMCAYAIANNFDFLFRVDSDAYVHLDRFLASDAFQHEAWGWAGNASTNSLNGGLGFVLGRCAMNAVLASEHFNAGSDKVSWYGDLWTAALLRRAGIPIARTPLMQDGQGSDDIQPEQVQPGMISIHPMQPDTMRKYHG